MKPSVSLAVFQAPAGMPALFSGAGEENLALIRALGYQGVDLFVLDPQSAESRAAAAALRRYGLGVGAVMPAALARQGLFLASEDAQVRRLAVEKVRGIIQYAAGLGGMVSLGLVRGNQGAGGAAAFEQRLANSCEQLLETAQPLGVPLLVEPINRYEIDNLNSSAQALRFVQGSGLPLGLMLDTFHMNIEDENLAQSFAACAPYTKHIHFVDSNRLAPGMGHLDLRALYYTVQATGYTGYLCLEALPRPDPHTCAQAGAGFFAKLS